MTSNVPPAQHIARLLIVETDFERLRPVADALRDEDFAVTICASLDAARARAKRLDFGVAIIDLPSADAAWHLEQFQLANPHLHVIVHADAPSRDDLKTVLNHGAFALIERAQPLDDLVEQVHRAFRDHYRRQAAEATHRAATPALAERQAAQLRQLVEHLPMMVVAFDHDGELALWNQEAERLTGYSRVEAAHHLQFLDPLFPGIRHASPRRRCDALSAAASAPRVVRIVAKDGRPRTLLWSHLAPETPIAGWAAWGAAVEAQTPHAATL